LYSVYRTTSNISVSISIIGSRVSSTLGYASVRGVIVDSARHRAPLTIIPRITYPAEIGYSIAIRL
jgi:hypothetical protein